VLRGGVVVADLVVRWDAPDAVRSLAAAMCRMIRRAGGSRPGFLCVGTDRSTGDSFGPLVGSMLAGRVGAHVAGTLADPVHAQNLVQRVEAMRAWGVCPLVVVDAHIGGEPGSLRLGVGGLEVAGGVCGRVGDIGLSGVVLPAVGEHFFGVMALGSVRLWLVLQMAHVAARAVTLALEMLGMPALDAGRSIPDFPDGALVAAVSGGEGL